MRIELAHVMPGRMRLRLQELDGNEAAVEALQQRLGSVPGLRQVQLRPSTGSVVLTFAPEQTDSIERAVRQAFPELERGPGPTAEAEAGPGEGPEAPDLEAAAEAIAAGERPDFGQSLAEAVAAFNRQVGSKTHGVDLAVLVPAGFVGLGISTLLRRVITGQPVEMPNWYNYIWYGYRMFSQNKKPEGEAKEDPQAELLEQLMDEVKQMRHEMNAANAEGR